MGDTERERDIKGRYIERDILREKETDRQRERERDRDKETETKRQRETDLWTDKD